MTIEIWKQCIFDLKKKQQITMDLVDLWEAKLIKYKFQFIHTVSP